MNSTGDITLGFAGVGGPVALRGCRSWRRHFPWMLQAWPVSEAPAAAAPPIMTQWCSDAGYRLETPWLAKPLERRDEVAAICGFIAELSRAYVEDPALACLHCAAAEFQGRLALFPNRYHAGKSVLAACLAARGVRIFTDDILPVELASGNGIALGAAPRLRNPLPATLTAETRGLIARRTRMNGDRYRYLDLNDRERAPHGTQAPIGGVVFLERTEATEAEILPVGPADALRQLIYQNFGRAGPAPVILDRLKEIVGRARCFRLRFARSDDAAALLQQEMSDWATEPVAEADFLPAPVGSGAAPIRRLPPGHYQRKAAIEERLVDGERFLADPDGGSIHTLNVIGSAVWQLLAQPISGGHIAETISAAFPDIPAGRVASDVANLLDTLAAKSLVIRGGSDGA